ncbi:hypothetical protein ACFWRG_34975 [Micromonospora tulbaghiae]|uniref:Uncharacterized protein n=2 Tax=Streptomyces TaxID=1883 RepID=A0A1E7LJ99_9ACTN|nr:hypothetical protein [Streptomyces nanshensis]OEV16295.1 hypothetical protein AN221_32300 [Streptomyces nanshensis]
MSKPSRKIIRLQQMRAQRASAAKLQFLDVVFENADGVEETCSFPVQDNWPLEVIEEVEEKGGNANLNVLREIAQPKEAFDRLITVAKLTVGELTDILDEMNEEAGTTQGEGSGSSSSSESTPEPSAPTSSGTTPAAA